MTQDVPEYQVTREEVAQPAEITVADIDANGYYRGVKAIAADEKTDAHVEVPADCDLKPGAYRWSELDGAFMPAPPQDPKSPELEIDALSAIAHGFIALGEQGMTLPPATVAWLKFYLTTIDFEQTNDADSRAMLKRFQDNA